MRLIERHETVFFRAFTASYGTFQLLNWGEFNHWGKIPHLRGGEESEVISVKGSIERIALSFIY